jgi:uncharacterized membrane-anchored protein
MLSRVGIGKRRGIVKILATTLGETAGDTVTMNQGAGSFAPRDLPAT